MAVVQPKVSVILPSLNVREYIEQCLASVLNQSLDDIEVICVDAGSTDGTLEAIREFQQKDARIKLLLSDRKSYGYQMNMGIDAAEGEYLGIVETDDWVEPQMYEDLYAIAKAENLDFVKGDFYRFEERESGSLIKRLFRLSNDESLYGSVFCPSEIPNSFKAVMNTWSGIYRLDFLRDHGIRHNETPGASYQDNGFWFQTFMWAQRARFVDTPYYMNRRDNPNSSVYSSSKVHAMKNEYDFIQGIIESDLKNLASFLPLCVYFRFCGYYYNTINRISPELREDFLSEFSNEFRHLADEGLLECSLFGKKEWEDLQKIMYFPEQFLAGSLRSNPGFHVRESYLSYKPLVSGCPRVSVIVPVYNVAPFLSECLDSILAQTLQDFEVLCVDDGSTDSSCEIIDEYAKKDSRVIAVHQENKGPSAARNKGLSLASGEYILFVDSDDGIAQNALAHLVETADKEQTDIVVFGLDIDHYSKAGQESGWIRTKNPKRTVVFNPFNPRLLFKEPGTKPFSVRHFLRRSFLAREGLWFAEAFKFGEDTIFSFEVFPRARCVAFIEDCLYFYRCTREGSLMAGAKEAQARKALWHIRIVDHIYSVWKSEGWVKSMRRRFVDWAIEFVNGQFKLCSEEFKPALAHYAVPVLRRPITNSLAEKLSERNRNILNDLSRYGERYTTNYADMSFLRSVNYPNGADERNSAARSFAYCPRVSFVVPAHNAEKTIRCTVESLLSQTYEDIEIIVVDDASTDSTSDILNEFEKADSRVRVLRYTVNKTASQARKDGVRLATGQFIMFCDADDCFVQDAAEIVVREMERDPVDVLHFGAVVKSHNAFAEDVRWVEDHTLPYSGRLEGSDVFEGCFRGELFGMTLWNKAYSAQLAKTAFEHIEDGAFPRGQDVYAFVVLSYFARSYRGLFENQLYEYNLGAGGDGTQLLSLAEFERFCALRFVSDAVLRFLENQKADKRYFDVWFSLRKQLIRDCVFKWQQKILVELKGRGFDLLASSWPVDIVCAEIAQRYWRQPVECVQWWNESNLLLNSDRSIKTVALYYHRVGNGGVEDVVLRLAALWQGMGYRVVIILDSQSAEHSAFSEGDIVWRSIPNQGANASRGYAWRALGLAAILKEEQVDALVYNAWNTSLLPWDMLVARATGAAFVIHCHGVFSYRLRMGETYFASMPWIFAQANGIVCLGAADQAFWSQFNGNVLRTVNPIEPDRLEMGAASLSGDNVLWVGRLSEEKHPEEALYIFKLVHELRPKAMLNILGKAESDEEDTQFAHLVKRLGLEHSVKLWGYQDDVTPAYKESSVFLCTSSSEGFSLALLDAQIFGLPTVMYDLPYLALVKGNQSIDSVPFGDREGAARAIVDLLDNFTLRKAKGQRAREFAEKFCSFDLEKAWKQIFSSIESCRQSNVAMADDVRVMWETLLSHYEKGVSGAFERGKKEALETAKESVAIRAATDKAGHAAASQIQRIKASRSYKIGRMATWPVRKMRRMLSRLKGRF